MLPRFGCIQRNKTTFHCTVEKLLLIELLLEIIMILRLNMEKVLDRRSSLSQSIANFSIRAKTISNNLTELKKIFVLRVNGETNLL